MSATDIAKRLLELIAALPPGEWRAYRDPKDGVADAGESGIVLRYDHPQEGLGLLGSYRPAWSTCEFVTFARNNIEELATALIEREASLVTRDRTAGRAVRDSVMLRGALTDIAEALRDGRTQTALAIALDATGADEPVPSTDRSKP